MPATSTVLTAADGRVCGRCGRVRPLARRGLGVCPTCYVQPERRCGRCGRVDEIAIRATATTADICVNCYRLPVATCDRCGRHRPCSHVAEGRPICASCQPRVDTECAHCGHVRPPTARWAEGAVCEACYRAALTRRGRCDRCGRERRLVSPPGPGATRCCDCAGIPALAACSQCGREDRLFERGRCAYCALARRATELLTGPDGHVPADLVAVRDAIAASDPPFAALNWLRQGAGAPILAALASGTMALTHDALDTHPRSRAAGYVRQLLVAHGALPERNESIAGLEHWIATTVDRIGDPEHRRLVHTFATWQTVRRLRRRTARIDPNRRVATRYARNQVAAAVAFLGWLDGHDLTLSDCTQEHINIWLTTGPASRRDARHFLAWTAQRGDSATFTISAPPEHDGDALDADQRWSIARRLLHDNSLALVDRVAGSFVLLYAQPLSRVAVLTNDQITTSANTVSVLFGRHAIELPAPLDQLVTTLAATRRRPHTSIGAPTTSPWLFPGHLPGRPITAGRLGARLGALGIDARAARRSALIQLATELPAPVLADSLGIKITTASDWVKSAGGDWANYAAATARATR